MSLQIVTIKGIPIRLHFTLVIVFFLVSWSLATNFMPEFYPDLSSFDYWTMGILGALLLFASVLLHELSHSIIALRYGIKVKQIILFIFGGVSDMEGEPKTSRKEFEIAFAGPATSFVLAAIFALLWWITSALSVGSKIVEGVFLYGAALNVLLGAFNLIPAFPLDGGRVLRAVLLKRGKDFDQSTKIAVKVGIAISYVFMGVGFVFIITGGFLGGIWLLLIGWFLQSGAQSYLYQHNISAFLSKVRLVEIMNTNIISIPSGTTASESLTNYFGVYMKSAFPVVDYQNHLLGMIILKDITVLPAEQRQHVQVDRMMIPAKELVVMDQNRSADEALVWMARTRTGRTFVCDSDGRLIGLVSKTDIMNVASERQDYAKAAGSG